VEPSNPQAIARQPSWSSVSTVVGTATSDGEPSPSQHPPMTPPHASFTGNLLSVPGAPQNIAAHVRSHSFSSNGTSTSAWTGGSPSTAMTASDIGDGNIDLKGLIKTDTKEEEVADNPFAFVPKQLAKLHDPKDLNVLRAMGGIIGLIWGLRTSIADGLSPDEDKLDRRVTLQDVWHYLETRKKAQVKQDIGKDTAEDEGDIQEHHDDEIQEQAKRRKSNNSLSKRTTRASQALQKPPSGFSDRKRIFAENRLPARKPKNIFQLMWMALHDKILVRTRLIWLT
jgi:P-type Ca2+ transporter type 2C